MLDPGLEKAAGHHVSVAAAIQTEAKAAGKSVEIFYRKTCDPAIVATLGEIPAFSNSPYDDPSPMKLSDIPGVQIQASQALKEISAITDSLLGANTLLVLNSFRVAHLAALGQWFARYTGQKFAPTVILLLTIELLRETASTNSTLEREQLKAAFRPFQCDALKVRLGVPSNLIANEMRQISGLAPVVCPTPHIFPRQVTNMGRPPQPAAGGIRIAVLGTARNEKGFPLLPGIVTQTLAVDPTHPSSYRSVQELTPWEKLSQGLKR
jgi:hypothetical protein